MQSPPPIPLDSPRLVLRAFAPLTAVTSTSVAPCPSPLTKSTTLTASCTGPVVLAHSKVSLNCAGFTVSASASAKTNGIILGPGLLGVTVRNCRVTDFINGFYLNGTHNDHLTNDTVTNESVAGFFLNAVANSSLLADTASLNDSYGFVLNASSYNNTLSYDAATGSHRTGYYLLRSPQNLLEHDTAKGGHYGFALISSRSDRLEHDSATRALIGFFVGPGSQAALLTGDSATGDRDCGFALDRVAHATLSSDRQSGSNVGFYLYDATFNTLSTNRATRDLGRYLLNDSSSNNRLEFDNASGYRSYGFEVASSGSNALSNDTANNTALTTVAVGFVLSSDSQDSVEHSTAVGPGNQGGFYVQQGTDNLLTDDTAFEDLYFGFYLNSTSGNTLSSDTGNSDGAIGIYLFGGSSNTVSDSTLDSEYTGLGLNIPSSNTLTGDTASANSHCGIGLMNSPSNLISSDTATGDSDFGFCLYGDSSNDLTNDVASGNGLGFALNVSSGNTLTSDEGTSNDAGFGVFGSSDNALDSDVASYNVYGFYDATASSINGAPANSYPGDVCVGNTVDPTNPLNQSYPHGLC